MNVASGCPEFADLSILDNTSYVKDDVMYIKAIVDTSKFFIHIFGPQHFLAEFCFDLCTHFNLYINSPLSILCL